LLLSFGKGTIMAAGKMWKYHLNYKQSNQRYHEGLIKAGLSGFGKGFISGTGDAVVFITGYTTSLNPVAMSGATIFKVGSNVVAEYVEFALEEMCDSVYNDRTRTLPTRENFKKATSEAGVSILIDVFEEKIVNDNMDPTRQNIEVFRKWVDYEIEKYRNRYWINTSVDHTWDAIEGDRI